MCIRDSFSDRVALNPNKFASKAKIIQIDIDPSELGKNCLLYTSMHRLQRRSREHGGSAAYAGTAACIVIYMQGSKKRGNINACLLYTSRCV